MEWMEVLKLLSDGNVQGTIDARLSAQQATLDAMARALEQLRTDYATLANNHADAIEHALRMNRLLAVLVLVVLLVLFAWIWKLERKVKALEWATGRGPGPLTSEVIEV